MTTQQSYTHNSTGLVERLHLHPFLSASLALGSAALAGALLVQTMPYGPTTTSQLLVAMTVSLLAGILGGTLFQSRWALLAIPVAFAFAVEIARPDVLGPTSGALRLDNTYGILALIVGRGFNAVVTVLPLLAGVGLALLFSGYLSATAGRSQAIVEKLLLALLVLLSIGLAAWALIPASTPALTDADGSPIENSIASLETVRLGGHDQAIMIRGRSEHLPVLLYLSGGPGQSDLPYSRVLFDDIAQDFVVVSWDQRGTGKSYSALKPAETLTLEQAVSDTIELTDYLRDRFDEDKIYLLGESWGTTLGVLAVQQRPDLYHAWIGSGQMVSQRETDQRLYQDVLALAEEQGNTALKEQMEGFGEPPYEDIPYPNAVVMGQYEQLYKPYTPPQDYIAKGTAANLGPWGILGQEYNLVEKVNVLRGLIDMFTIMYPQLQSIDFRQDVRQLEVPVYILDGAAELDARRDLTLEWYAQLEAPSKQIFTFENAGHSVAFEQMTAFSEILRSTILPETYPSTQAVAP